MATFNPDQYLAGFDPDQYLAEQPTDKFDPDVYLEPEREVGVGEAVLRGAAQGVTFGFADEIAGLAGSLTTDKSYQETRDASRQAFREAREQHPGVTLASEVVGGIAVPGAGLARAAGIVGAGAIGGAIAGLGYTEEEEAVDIARDVAIGGAMGAVAGAAFKAVGSGLRRITGNHAQNAMRQNTQGLPTENTTIYNKVIGDNADDIMTRALRIREGMSDGIPAAKRKLRVKGEVIQDITEAQQKLPPGLVRYMQGLSPGEQVSDTQRMIRNGLETWNSMTPDQQQRIYNDYLNTEAFRTATSEFMQTYGEKIAGIQDPGATLLSYLKDPLIRGVEVDGAAGTDVSGALLRLGEGINRAQAASGAWLRRLEGIRKEANSLLGKNYETRLQDILNGHTQPRNAAEVRVTKSFRKYYKDFLEEAPKHGLQIRGRESYTPNLATDRMTMLRRLDTEWAKIKRQGGIQPGKPTHDAFLDAVTWVNQGVEPQSAGEITGAINRLARTGDREIEGLMDIASLLPRKGGGVPELLVEQDAFKAAVKYTSGMFRGHYLRPALANLKTQEEALQTLGFQKSAAWVDKIGQRIQGEPSGFTARVEEASTRWQRTMHQIATDPNKGWLSTTVAEMARDIPDALSFMSGQIYPNLLGWRVDAPIRNMTQTLTMTMPELGKEGAQHVTKGWLQAAKNIQGAKQFLIDRGISPGDFAGESSRRALQDGLYRWYGAGATRQAIDKLGQFGMKFYGASDTANRYITWYIGQSLGDSLLAGGAKDFARRMPRPLKAKWDAAVRAGSHEKAKEELSRYLIGKTQFDYSKAGLSEFGQDFGRFVTMLSKWPMMIYSDAAHQVRYGQGMEKFSRPMLKYATPLAMAIAGEHFISEMDASDDPIKKILLGNNLVNWAPASSMRVTEMPTFLGNTLTETSKGMWKVLDGDIEGAKRQAERALKPFVPGVVPVERYRRLVED